MAKKKRKSDSPATNRVAEIAEPILGLATREFKFHLDAGGKRRWAFDLAWPDHKIAVEIEGGAWIGGRHTSGAGFSADCEKYSIASIMGWTLIRLTPQMVKNEEVVKTWLSACFAPGFVVGNTPIKTGRRRKK